jgi:hypothetical protein
MIVDRRRPLLLVAALLASLVALILPADPAAAATIAVTTTADNTTVDGAVSLREAITSINNGANLNGDVVASGAYGTNDTIRFNIAGTAPFVMNLAGPEDLPMITRPVTVDGLSQGPIGCPLPTGALTVQIDGGDRQGVGLTLGPGSDGSTIRGLSITNFGNFGISVDASNNHRITCNSLGVEADGSDGGTNGNNFAGVFVFLSTNTTIGGLNAGEGNVIAHNYIGVFAEAVIGNRVQGNMIRDNRSNGVQISSSFSLSSSDNTIQANTISGNAFDGVLISEPAIMPGNRVTQNSIFSNGTTATDLGIDLQGANGVEPNDAGDGDGGANNRQNYPVLARASTNGATTTVVGTLDSVAGVTYTIEFFSNPACDASGHGEGRVFLGSTTVTIEGGNPTGAFSATLPTAVPLGHVVTATATRDAAPPDTSEFSACRPVTPPPGAGVVVTPTGGLTTTEAGGATQFTVQLTTQPTAPVTLALTSSDTTEGTVSPPSLTFQPDATALNPQIVTVTGVQDTIVDGSVPYTIVTGPAASADPAYNGLDAADVAVTNADDETQPALTIGDAAVAEGDAGTSALSFAVTLDPPSASVVTVQYATINGTATGGAGCGAGVDYQTTGGTLTFQPLETSKTIAVIVCADTVGEGNESLAVNLGTATNAILADGQGVGTITDNDMTGRLSFSTGSVQAPENAGSVTLTVQRTGVSPAGAPASTGPAVPNGSVQPGAGSGGGPIAPAAAGATSVSFATVNGSALAGQDYVAASGTLSFAVGETTRTIRIQILQDDVVEGHESFTVTLSSPTGGASLGQQATITVVIVDTTPGTAFVPSEDDPDRPRKETENQRREREHTNRAGRDDIATEGNVLETRCDAAWPSVVIANRDGAVEVRLLKEAVAACRSIRVGDYLEADGEKQHELLFDAESIEILRGGKRVGFRP